MDPELEIYNKIAAMKQDVDVLAANDDDPERFAFATEDTAVAKESLAGTFDDFPMVTLELIRAEDRQQPKVFGHNKLNFTSVDVDHVLPQTLRYELVVIYDDLNLTNQRELENAIDDYLTKLWPKMGLSWVASFSTTKTRRNEQTALTNNTLMTVVRRLITVDIRPYLSQLLA